MGQFLAELDHLFKRGLRFDYQRIEEEQRFLRGQLNVVAQMRQPAGRQHCFQIRHDVFMPDRPENRVLKFVLERICTLTQLPDNWRLAQELRNQLAEIPASRYPHRDLSAWSDERLMAHYRAVKPWCELILIDQMPLSVSGQWQGMSLLFPMPKLFEQYVAGWLRTNLSPDASLRTQARSEFLCQHQDESMFRLEPDLLVTKGDRRWVLDTKWKRIDAKRRDNNYGLGQADFYQLFAYGQKYLKGAGELVLIYPSHGDFVEALARFSFADGLGLHVLPFDLDACCLIDPERAALPVLATQASIAQVSGA